VTFATHFAEVASQALGPRNQLLARQGVAPSSSSVEARNRTGRGDRGHTSRHREDMMPGWPGQPVAARTDEPDGQIGGLGHQGTGSGAVPQPDLTPEQLPEEPAGAGLDRVEQCSRPGPGIAEPGGAVGEGGPGVGVQLADGLGQNRAAGATGETGAQEGDSESVPQRGHAQSVRADLGKEAQSDVLTTDRGV
jgi:hypothetical protein